MGETYDRETALLKEITKSNLMLAKMADALDCCAAELDAWVSGHYASLQIDVYPNNKFKYERDMTPVREARKILKEVEEIIKCLPT